MPTKSLVIGAAMAAALVLSTPVLAQGADPFPPGDGHDVVVKACVQCHGPEVITGTGKSREDWTMTVNTMISNGAVVPEADFPRVIDYLAKSFPER
jgi:mono/diheme cytochrome c family protein